MIYTDDDFDNAKTTKDPNNAGASIGSKRTVRSLSNYDFDGSPMMCNAQECDAKRGFNVGDRIINRYVVVSVLGRGAMGVVYKCHDEVTGTEVALKALPPELSHDTHEMEDIRDNFQLVEKLHHPNIAIAKTLEKDTESGDYYLIMECVSGESLRSYVREKRKSSSLSLAEILPILEQVASALDYAHGQRVIHRDIKPANIMMSAGGTVKVLDFGLAAQIHSSLTRVSQIHYDKSGTGAYMAPEQWEGCKQDAATDQYALAVMTYEMITGNLPFDGADTTILREAVLKSNAKELANVPKHVNAALAKAMSKDPAERFASCIDFVKALTDEKVGAEKKKGKRRLVAVVLIAAMVVLIAAIATAICVGKPSSGTEDRGITAPEDIGAPHNAPPSPPNSKNQHPIASPSVVPPPAAPAVVSEPKAPADKDVKPEEPTPKPRHTSPKKPVVQPEPAAPVVVSEPKASADEDVKPEEPTPKPHLASQKKPVVQPEPKPQKSIPKNENWGKNIGW